MARYEWPPRPVLDVDEAAQMMADALDAAWEDLEAERVRVLESDRMLRKAYVDAWLKEYQAALAVFGADIQHHLERFVTLHVGPRYLAGVRQGGGSPVWTAMHSAAFTSLSIDTYSDFLQRSEEAMQTSAEFAQVIRETARTGVPGSAGGARTPKTAARAWAEQLTEEYDITHVIYADGSRVPIRAYTEMASLTKSAVAYNAGTLNECTASGVSFVEVFDGTDCGWVSHGSSDKANGSIRHVDDAAAHPISHPRCQRAFGPRPDVTTRKAAKNAAPSTTQEQRDDQADIDYFATTLPVRASTRTRARAARQERRAARAGS